MSEYTELVKELRGTSVLVIDPVYSMMLQAADAIEELSRRCEQFQYMPLPKWISVKDEPPEPETAVLAAFDDGEVWSLWQKWGEAEHEESLWYPKDWNDENRDYDWHLVTHWMPLPKPPKEEGRK